MRTQADRPATRRRSPSRATALLGVAAGLLCLALAVPNLGPSLRAARAEGTAGTFTAGRLECVQHPGHEACSWSGTFRPDGGGPAVETSLYGGRHGLHEGDTTAAVDVGRSRRVYPPGGSHEWIATVLLLLVGVGLLVLSSISRMAARDRRQKG